MGGQYPVTWNVGGEKGTVIRLESIMGFLPVVRVAGWFNTKRSLGWIDFPRLWLMDPSKSRIQFHAVKRLVKDQISHEGFLANEMIGQPCDVRTLLMFMRMRKMPNTF
jgi:hypothetical protein